jgi:hypothetical protein
MDGTSHHQSKCQWSHIMCYTAPIIGSSGLVTGQGCACDMLQSKGTANRFSASTCLLMLNPCSRCHPGPPLWPIGGDIYLENRPAVSIVHDM